MHDDHSLSLTLQDLFAMAEQVEVDGEAFYRRAAQSIPSPSTRKVFERLAEMETEHGQIFSSMKSLATDETLPTTGAWPGSHCSCVVGALASGVKDHLVAQFDPHDSREIVLQKALEFEKDTIVFFLSLKDLLETDEQRRHVDDLVREELGHIFQITEELLKR